MCLVWLLQAGYVPGCQKGLAVATLRSTRLGSSAHPLARGSSGPRPSTTLGHAWLYLWKEERSEALRVLLAGV